MKNELLQLKNNLEHVKNIIHIKGHDQSEESNESDETRFCLRENVVEMNMPVLENYDSKTLEEDRTNMETLDEDKVEATLESGESKRGGHIPWVLISVLLMVGVGFSLGSGTCCCFLYRRRSVNSGEFYPNIEMTVNNENYQ